MMFSFSHPQYLFLLFAIPVIFVIHFLSLSNKKKNALKFANFDAIARIEGVDFFSKNIVILFFSLFIVAFLVLAISGLTFHTVRESSSFSFVLALDASQSMEATDMLPDRITVSKQTAVDFVKMAPADVRMGVLSFSGSSYMEQEITENKDEIKRAIQSIQVGGYGGTDLYEAILTSTNLLDGEETKSIILLSDGQINIGNIDDAVEYANDNDVMVHSIAIGTVEGGMTSYAVSKLDEASLKSVAYNTGGEYFNVADKDSLMSSFLDILKITKRKVSVSLFNYLLIAAIVLFMFKFFLINTRYINLP